MERLYEKECIAIFASDEGGGRATVLCEMGKILNKKYNVVVLSPSDGAMRTQFEEAGISVLISGEITDALRDMIVQEFDFAVANTTLALPVVVKLAGRMPVYWWIHEGTLAYEGRQEMKEYYQLQQNTRGFFLLDMLRQKIFITFTG